MLFLLSLVALLGIAVAIFGGPEVGKWWLWFLTPMVLYVIYLLLFWKRLSLEKDPF